ncbi:MAG TPA: DMT family transporter [Gemmatimonadales bacterium]|nr:DMT family transporter [Gemmatimonadales bacterium]
MIQSPDEHPEPAAAAEGGARAPDAPRVTASWGAIALRPQGRPAAASGARHSSAADLGMLLVCLIWGVNFSVTKIAIGEIPALPFTAVRFALASLLLWVVVRLVEGPARIEGAAWRRLVVLGIVGNTCYQLMFILGLAHTTATNSALIVATVPTVVAVIAWALGLERVTRRMWWGIALGTIGVALVIVASGVEFSTGTLRGDLLTVVAVFCWAGYTVDLRRLPPGVSPLRVTMVTSVAGTPGLVLAGLPGLVRLDWAAISTTGWAALAYATLLSLVVAYILWNRSVQTVGGTRTAIYMCLTPLFAVIAAWIILGERAHASQAIGAVLIVAGVLLTRW